MVNDMSLPFSNSGANEIFGVYNSPRITESSISKISHCVFAFLYIRTHGSAVYISSTASSLDISDTCFRSCMSNNPGGSIYLVIGKNYDVIRCIWEMCFIYNGGDNIHGNTMYASSPSITINLTASLKCGPDISISGDSTQHLRTSKLRACVMNNTDCCSYGGSACFELDGLTNTNDNVASHTNTVNGSAAHCQSNYPSPSTLYITRSNFITTQTWNCVFYAAGKTTYFECFVWFNSHPAIVNDQTKIDFDKCFGNVIEISQPTDYQSILINPQTADFCGIVDYKLSRSCSINFMSAVVLFPLAC